jgi:hypothetical protein
MNIEQNIYITLHRYLGVKYPINVHIAALFDSRLEIANYPMCAKSAERFMKKITPLNDVYIPQANIHRLGVGLFIVNQVFGDTSNK